MRRARARVGFSSQLYSVRSAVCDTAPRSEEVVCACTRGYLRGKDTDFFFFLGSDRLLCASGRERLCWFLETVGGVAPLQGNFVLMNLGESFIRSPSLQRNLKQETANRNDKETRLESTKKSHFKNNNFFEISIIPTSKKKTLFINPQNSCECRK